MPRPVTPKYIEYRSGDPATGSREVLALSPFHEPRGHLQTLEVGSRTGWADDERSSI